MTWWESETRLPLLPPSSPVLHLKAGPSTEEGCSGMENQTGGSASHAGQRSHAPGAHWAGAGMAIAALPLGLPL